MSAITLVTNSVGLRAILVSKPIDRAQLERLYELAGDNFRAAPRLAKRWGVWAVITPADYERYLGDAPAPPSGLKLQLQSP